MGAMAGVDAELLTGVRLLASGTWRASHEAFETAWRRSHGESRDLLQALAQLAAALLCPHGTGACEVVDVALGEGGFLGQSSSRASLTVGPSAARATFTTQGRQQTGQSSTYCSADTPVGST